MDSHKTEFFDGESGAKVEVSYNTSEPEDDNFLYLGIENKYNQEQSTALDRETTVALRDHLNFLLDEPVTEAVPEGNSMAGVAKSMDDLYEALIALDWTDKSASRMADAYFKGAGTSL
jgi:hypothetical protein